jgi:hypothetical protein
MISYDPRRTPLVSDIEASLGRPKRRRSQAETLRHRHNFLRRPIIGLARAKVGDQA